MSIAEASPRMGGSFIRMFADIAAFFADRVSGRDDDDDDDDWAGFDAALSMALIETPAMRSDAKRVEIKAERESIEREEAQHLAIIAYHEREIEKARKHLADLALCRDANDASAAILNAPRAIDLRRALEEDYDIACEGEPGQGRAA